MDVDVDNRHRLNSHFNWKSVLRYEPIVPLEQRQDQHHDPVGTATYNSNVDYRLVHTDKIFLPSSALQDLVNRASDSEPLPSPLTFKLSNVANNKSTYVGVREFSAPENIVNIPVTLARELDLKENSNVSVAFHHLPKGTAVTFRLLEEDDNDTDWKHLLEHRLHGSYTTLVKGREISVVDPKDSHTYTMVVAELRPADAVCIVDTDLDLDIVPPLETAKKRLDQKLQAKSASALTHEQGPIELTPDTTKIVTDSVTPGLELKFYIKGWDRHKDLHITTSNPLTDFIFVSTDEYTVSTKSFIWSNITDLGKPLTLSAKDEALKPGNLYGVVIPSTTSLSIETTTNPTTTKAAGKKPQTVAQGSAQGYKLCDNCGQTVSEQSYMLHSSFCLRNNAVCPDGCGLVYNKREGLPEGHWHCNQCLPVIIYGDSFMSKQMHDQVLHQNEQQVCDCGQIFATLSLLGRHKALECPQELHICRFCHLRLPREVATPQDVLQGLSGHESYCGNRTIDCDVCKKTVRLRDVESHMEFHDMDRRQGLAPVLCSNVNCIHTVELADLTSRNGLCTACYAPLHSTAHDPTGTRLQQRLERRYVLQLTRGCAKPWCINQYCVTADPSLKKQGMAAAMKITKELMAKQPNYYFCVDEGTTKRKMFVDFESEQSDYSREWCAKAIQEARGNENEARHWLQLHAVKRSEA